MLKKIVRFVFNSDYRRYFFAIRGFYKKRDDKEVIDYLFKYKIGRTVDWSNPLTFNEKIQWIKVYDRNPLYTKLVDKIEVKKYVSNILGEKYIVPTIGVFDSFDDIPFDELPDRFVIKCNHDSGGVVICDDKKNFDFAKAKKRIEKSLKRNYYWISREWAYKEIKPRILVEEYLEEVAKSEVPEYKFFCFSGKPTIVDVCKGKAHTTSRTNDYCDMNLNRLPVKCMLPNSEGIIEKPQNYETMIMCAEKLAKGFPEVRMDFYNINGRIYFGEYTFTSNGGIEKFEPDELDYYMGSLIDLSKVDN